MFVGHLALALAAKRVDPEISLGWFVAAVILLDLVWPIFVLAGVERVSIIPGATEFTPLLFVSYPWSHSLAMSIVWGVLLAILARSTGHTDRTSWLIAGLVVTHWVLDVAAHAPDLPLWRGESPKLGLGLWKSIAATYLVEGSMWISAIVFYLWPRNARRLTGPLAFWSFVGLTTLIWASVPWSPTPSSIRALAYLALSSCILIPWAILADRNYSIGVES